MTRLSIRGSRTRAGLTGVLVALTCTAGLAACGSSEYTYVTNKGEQTYFKVPASWSRVDESALRAFFQAEDPDSILRMAIDQERWVVGFDSSAQPDLAHVVPPSGGVPIAEPVILAMIQGIGPEDSGTFSLERMRNLLVPTTEDAERQASEALAAQGLQYNVDVLGDMVVAPTAGLHGVRRIYNVKLGPLPLETHDLTVLVNNDETKLYLFLVRCATVCWFDRQSELLEIADSFTVVGRT